MSRLMLLLAPVLAALLAVGLWQLGVPPAACWCALVATWTALWWIFEAVPIAVAALLPFVFFPLSGVLDHSAVATAYGHPMILLLMGGAFLSKGMERSGAHRRIAVMMVRAVGGSGGRRLVLGFMLATASLSMWISNTATALMMLPIALAVLERSGDPRLRMPLLLGIAYSASVGGMATPIGTPPNVILMGVMQETFGDSPSFASWMRFGLLCTAVLLPIIWLWITRDLGRDESRSAERDEDSDDGPIVMPTVGPWRPAERRVLVIFALAALAWIFREAPGGGWVTWIGAIDAEGNAMAGDGTVALIAALLMFVTPAGEASPERGPEARPAPPHRGGKVARTDSPAPRRRWRRGADAPLLDWKTAEEIPWGILLMFGGGLALAAGFESSGLSSLIGSQLTRLGEAPPWLLLVSICLLVTFMTEITSSTATITLLLPILAALSISSGIRPELVMIPATLSASCAFMLPVATAPNAIVFSAGGLTTTAMARTGLMLNLFGVAVISTICWWLL